MTISLEITAWLRQFILDKYRASKMDDADFYEYALEQLKDHETIIFHKFSYGFFRIHRLTLFPESNRRYFLRDSKDATSVT